MNDSTPTTAPDPNAPASVPGPIAAPSASGSGRRAGPITLVGAVAVIAGASILFGLVAGAVLRSSSTPVTGSAAAPEHVVTVSGVGQVSVTPDVADVLVGAAVQRPTVAAAQSAAADSMSAVVAAIKKDGVADKDIVTVNLSLSPVYDYSSGGGAPRLVGYQFVNAVRVTVRAIASVASVVDDAVAAGATTIGGITFRVDDPRTVQARARSLAMADARSKADALTSAAGVSIRGVATISEATLQTNPTYAAAALAADKTASTPIQTGTTDIVVSVTVSYLIG
ncbi:MAG: SIMPL domain-containing protein [Candidatus Limnocylindrales bacterium]